MATYQETLNAWNKAQQDLEIAKAKIPKVGLYTGADAADVYGAAETARQNFYAADKALINIKNQGASELLSAGAKDYGLSNEQGTADYLASGLSPQDFLAGKNKQTPTAFETALKGEVAGGKTMEQAQQAITPEGTKRATTADTSETSADTTVNAVGADKTADTITLSNGQTAVRDLAKEKLALAEYGKIYGKMPQSDADWQKLHDIAYAGDKKATIPTGFEKIGHPDLVGQYDNIRRVGEVGAPGSYLIGKKKVVDNTAVNNANAQADELQKAKDILNKYGVDTPDSNQSPATTFTDTYKKLFTDLGLDTVKQSIKDGTTAIQKLKDEMNDKIIDVNDNPWLSEALRTKKINSIQNSYEGKLSNLTQKLQLDQSLLQSGQQEAQFVAGTGVTIAHNQQVLDQQMQLKLMEIAEIQTTNKIKTQIDLLKEGWNYVSTPLERDDLKKQGYSIMQFEGRTYTKMPESKTTFERTGTDENNNPIYGFVDVTNKVIKPINTTTSETQAYFTDANGDSWNIAGWAANDNTKMISMQTIANKIGKVDDSNIEQKIKEFTPGLTADIIRNTSAKTGVSWEALMTMVAQESTGGISNVAKNNNNFGGLKFNNQNWIKQFGGIMGTSTPSNEDRGVGHYIKFPTKQAGLDAMGALMASYGKVSTPDKIVIKEAKDWAKLIAEKKAKLSDVVVKGSDIKTNNLRKLVISEMANSGVISKADAELNAGLQDKVNQINNLIKTGSYKKVVGTTGIGRTPLLSALTGEAQDATGNIKQIVASETLDTLIALKKSGGTLGALSDKEALMLRESATKIGGWEVLKDGVGTGRWNVNENSFKKELENLKMLAERAIKNAGGVTEIVLSLEQLLASNPNKIDEYNVLVNDNSDLTDDEIIQLLNL